MGIVNNMKLATATILSAFAAGASAFAPVTTGSVKSTSLASTKGGLETLAKDLNPVVGYFDPLSLAEADFWGQGEAATIGFLRQAEIMHSRVAMAAFVGYCVQSNIHWPWLMTLEGDSFPLTDLSPEAQWDAIPANAKWQILLVIGCLEIWDEAAGGGPASHYMRGGQPGKYPSFAGFRDNVHWVLDLYDPFGLSKKMTDEKKEKRLSMEINNGRLAMLGIFGFLSADKIPGSVPLLKGIAIPYDGDVMTPFSADFSFFSS